MERLETLLHEIENYKTITREAKDESKALRDALNNDKRATHKLIAVVVFAMLAIAAAVLVSGRLYADNLNTKIEQRLDRGGVTRNIQLCTFLWSSPPIAFEDPRVVKLAKDLRCTKLLGPYKPPEK